MNAFAVAHNRTFASPEQLANEVADWIGERADASRGRFALCLSGGETPKRLYELLAAPARRERFPWERTHCFWGDERVVAHDDPRSNFRMAWDVLLRHVPVPAENVHPIPTEGRSAAAAAAEYESVLKRFYGATRLDAARPLFDLTLLGLGEDGHTASLFPGSPALAETERWAVGVTGSGPLDRISLTYPALASSADTAFVVVGARKRDVLSRLRAGDTALPAARLQSAGAVFCFADRAATATPAFS